MATTQKGIYYPDDYTAIADVPEDMKDLAESVDTALGNLEDNIEQNIQPQIDDIVSEQTTQNNNIEALQIENARLKATLPTTTDTGENITLSNTAELEFIQPPLPRGNSEQVQYSGKNLVDIGTQNFTTFYQKTGLSIPAGTYNISAKVTSSDTTNTISRVYLYDENGTQNAFVSLNRNTRSNASVTTSFIIAKIVLYSAIDYSTSNGKTATYEDVQLEQGSTATAYEPYCGGTASPNPQFPSSISNVTGDVEVVVQNKNLFDGITASGEFTSSGNINANNDRKYTTNYINVLPNTQYVSSSAINRMCFYDKDKNFISRSSTYNFTTFTTLSNAYYIRFDMTASTDTSILQLEQGTTATTYTPHKEQTFTFPLGTQRMYLGDYLADDGIHHARGEVTLDGSEDWSVSALSDTIFRFVANIDLNGINYEYNNTNGYCNYFKYIMIYSGGLTTNPNRAYVASSSAYIITSVATTVADFKTWLGTHNIIIEYELATEEITPYTTEQQTAYDEIKQAISYEEQTNISGSSDELEPIFDVVAYQSIKLILAS